MIVMIFKNVSIILIFETLKEIKPIMFITVIIIIQFSFTIII
jgi:hypothetical protein